MKFVFLILTALVALSACSNKSEEKAVVGNVMLYAPPKPMQKVSSADDWDDTPAGQSLSDTSHKIIKTGEIIFETSNLKDKRKRIIRVLSALNGYVSEDNQNFNHEYNRQEFIMEVRLPSRKFDLLIDSVETGVDKIDSKTISVKDVTTQFIDIKTALANKRTLENTYLSLLNKANKISDVLAIENKLTQIRTTIDSTQGELNYLRKQVAYSSIKITMYTKQVPQIADNDFGFKFRSALNDGWNAVQSFFLGIISIWPFVIILSLSTVLGKWWFTRRKLKAQP